MTERSTKISAAILRRQLQEWGLPVPLAEEGAALLLPLFEKAAHDPDLPTELPKRVKRGGKTFFKAPWREPIPLYGERTDNRDAIEFYEHYWRPYELAGLLSQAELRSFNDSLLTAIRRLCDERGLKKPDYLPPTKSEFIARKIAASGLTDDEIKQAERHIRYKERQEKASIEGEPMPEHEN